MLLNIGWLCFGLMSRPNEKIGMAECCLHETGQTRYIHFVPRLRHVPSGYQCITIFIVHEYLQLSMNVSPKTRTKPTSVRHKPGYIKTAAVHLLITFCSSLSRLKKEFLEDLATCWVYVSCSAIHANGSLIPRLSLQPPLLP